MYRDMRTKLFKEENLLEVLIKEQIDQIPELLYNDDSQKKYIDHPKYLHMLHGSRREHMRKWITERLLYLDSKFGYEMHTKDMITIRANNKGNVQFKIKTYSPMYVKVKWSAEANGTVLQKVGRNKTVDFNYTLSTATDQEIIIYGAKHLKEIGDLTGMKPSSLTLGSATRLTKLTCTNSPNLQALGLGGLSSDGTDERMKNLQEIDLTGCYILGTVGSNTAIDVSYCDNLKVLKAHGTKLQSISFNAKGGNLEELYLPNSMTSLYLANQYNLRKVEFPSHTYTDRLDHKSAYESGSRIANLTINNCPNLSSFGLNRTSYKVDLGLACNYRGVLLKDQPDDFDISKDDYIKAFTLSSFARLERVNITNSLLDYKYYNVNASPNLTSISFNNMPNLKGLILTGNRTYGATGGNLGFNFEGSPSFENISVNNCNNFDTLIIQESNKWAFSKAYKFKPDFTLDLSHLPLKRFICSIALQNLKKIILPSCIEEFSHSSTNLHLNIGLNSNGYSGDYAVSNSPLETIVIAGQNNTDEFKGIDLASKLLKNVNLNGLTQKVEIIKNVNCEAIDINPRIMPGQLAQQVLENIQINLNKYKGKSFYGTFKNADMSKIQVTLDNNITVDNIDYSEMFNNAKQVSWEKIKWLKKLPKGKFYRTFTNCDVDRLEVGNMIGETTVNMDYCFYNMPNVTVIDLTGANTNNVTNFQYCFKDSKKLEQLIGAENLIKEKCTNIQQMFYNTYKLKFSFPNNKPNWRLRQGGIADQGAWLQGCGKDVVLEENEQYILDLRGMGVLSGNYYNRFADEREMGFTHFYADNWDFTNANSHGSYSNYSYNPNLVELHLKNFKVVSSAGGFIYSNPNLETLNLEGTDLSKMSSDSKRTFANNPKLKNVTFVNNMRSNFDFSASTLLTVESLLSIVNGLADLRGSNPQTAKLGKANLDKLSESEKQIAIDKNWTLTA